MSVHLKDDGYREPIMFTCNTRILTWNLILPSTYTRREETVNGFSNANFSYRSGTRIMPSSVHMTSVKTFGHESNHTGCPFPRPTRMIIIIMYAAGIYTIFSMTTILRVYTQTQLSEYFPDNLSGKLHNYTRAAR